MNNEPGSVITRVTPYETRRELTCPQFTRGMKVPEVT